MVYVEGSLTFTGDGGGSVAINVLASGATAAKAVENATESWTVKVAPAVEQALEAYTDGRVGGLA